MEGVRDRRLRLPLRLGQIDRAVGGVWRPRGVVGCGWEGLSGRGLGYRGRGVAAHGCTSVTIHAAQLRHDTITLGGRETGCGGDGEAG